MECKYEVIKQDIDSFVPQYHSICTRCASEPPFPICNKRCCWYWKEKQEEELRNNPPPSPGYRYCPYRPNSTFQCSIYLNDCRTCGFNPAVQEQREKEFAERKRLKEESKLSYKIKRFLKKSFKKERES